MSFFIGNREFFPGIGGIAFEGKASKNPLAFKFYDKDKLIMGKTMAEHLRFAVCYWHSFCGTGSDPFGSGTREFPWTLLQIRWTRQRAASTLHSNSSPSWVSPSIASTIATWHLLEAQFWNSNNFWQRWWRLPRNARLRPAS